MTFTAAEARDRQRATPVVLAEIQLMASGPLLCLSDRGVSVGGVVYSDYLAAVTGVGDSLTRATSQFANSAISLVIKNDPWDASAHLTDLFETYPIEGAAITLKTCYLDDDGTAATPETIFVGNLDSPTSITAISFTCAGVCREAWASVRNR